ncbi:hypothetical protein F5544_33695 [Nocardia arthritidis]|uniref:Uncharacterized protein n=1 Tax=Nocardia arthritidis TaxID=228602 RepID=A0A6G9YMY8_9NOCA|nr:hypothetical protein F5544_33695 [Nocardia arthritidis]
MHPTDSGVISASCTATHLAVEPKILYFGTPVAFISTENEDGSFNLAPMSSAWALGQVVVLGLGAQGQTAHNLRTRPELVINLPSAALWPAVERLAPLTGRYPVPPTKDADCASNRRSSRRPGCMRLRRTRCGRRASWNARCNWRPMRTGSARVPPAGSSSSRHRCVRCTPTVTSSYPAPTTSTPQPGTH